MTLSRSLLLFASVLGSAVHAQRQYGFNHRDVIQDNDVVAKFFPDVDIELRSPAFLTPETVPKTFAEGKTGPTDDAVLGKQGILNGLHARNTD